MKKLLVRMGTGLSFFTPAIALAQFGEVDTFIKNVSNFINNVLIPLVFAIALLAFIYGAFKYFIATGLTSGDGADSRKEGTQLMLYSVIGFVLMVSIFGIVNLIANGLGFSDDQNIENIPNVPSSNR